MQVEGESEEFSDIDDSIVYNQRIEIEKSLDLAKLSIWDCNIDERKDICGEISSNCFRLRHKTDKDLLPSLSMINPYPTIISSKKCLYTLEYTTYSTDTINWEGTRIKLPKNTSIYGMGETAGELELNDMLDYIPHSHKKKYDQNNKNNVKEGDFIPDSYKRTHNISVCWNTDAYYYDESFESLYQSHPWVFIVFEDGTSLGILIDCTFKSILHLCKDTSNDNNDFYLYFLCESPISPPPIYLFPCDTPQEVLMELSKQTGKMELAPKWALGYQQCRYSYYPDTQVLEIANEFRKRKIPCDVIWMDIHYMNGYRCFTFDPKLFPNPKQLNNDLHKLGFKSIWMIDPGIKYEEGYSVYDSGSKDNHWIRYDKDSSNPVIGKVWPGKTVFPDFTQEKTRLWWGELFKDYINTGIDGVWNDMNEIASFQIGKTIPLKSFHNADDNIGGPYTHNRYHNVYGMLMTKASRDGILKANPNKRPFVLTRANFIGGQRYAACWTGDNTSNWKHLHYSIPMVLNLGLSGQPFSGIDIGGFFKNATPTLYGRWVGVGAMLPFARAHTVSSSKYHEPWLFGKDIEDTCRRAIERRYRLLAYFYTLFWEASTIGLPIARPLFFLNPKDLSLRNINDSFVLGNKLIVSVCTKPIKDKTFQPILPDNYNWNKIFILNNKEEEENDINLPELYQKSGSIIPMYPICQNIEESNKHNLDVYIFLDNNGKASGNLYEDNDDGFEYKNGEFLNIEFNISLESSKITFNSLIKEGNMKEITRTLRFYITNIKKETIIITKQTNSLNYSFSQDI